MKSSIKKKVKQHQNVLTIRSAIALKDQERRRIIELFRKKTGKRFDKIVSIIDPRIICGISAKSDSFGFEYSGRDIIEGLIEKITL